MRRLAFGLILALALTLAVRDLPSAKPARAQADVTVTVTSAADELAGAECPHAELCTLRAAITFVNADLSEDTMVIEFEAVVFPIAAPATITIATTSLPAITRSDVGIDARSAGVLLEGTAGVYRGLQVFGDRVAVRGLAIQGFTISCLEVAGTALRVGGDSTTGEGNVVGGCNTGILAGGTDAIVAGNVVGFDVDGAPASLETGVRIVGDGAIVGGEEPGQGNVIGNASTAIHVDFVLAGVVRVVGNAIGQADGGTAAPVSVGILVDRAVPGPEITSNLITNAGTGISVPETAQGSSTAVTMRNNTFEALGGLAIDLAGDGIRNENDPGDSDIGANDRLNHPTITRAARTEISAQLGPTAGAAPSTSCSPHTPPAERTTTAHSPSARPSRRPTDRSASLRPRYRPAIGSQPPLLTPLGIPASSAQALASERARFSAGRSTWIRAGTMSASSAPRPCPWATRSPAYQKDRFQPHTNSIPHRSPTATG